MILLLTSRFRNGRAFILHYKPRLRKEGFIRGFPFFLGDELMSRLRGLNPSALDMEVRMLAPSRDELVDTLAAIGESGATTTANPYARLSAFLTLLLNR